MQCLSFVCFLPYRSFFYCLLLRIIWSAHCENPSFAAALQLPAREGRRFFGPLEYAPLLFPSLIIAASAAQPLQYEALLHRPSFLCIRFRSI